MVMERMDTSRLKFQVKRIESLVDRDHEMEAMTSITASFYYAPQKIVSNWRSQCHFLFMNEFLLMRSKRLANQCIVDDNDEINIDDIIDRARRRMHRNPTPTVPSKRALKLLSNSAQNSQASLNLVKRISSTYRRFIFNPRINVVGRGSNRQSANICS